jgi:hypothetical protein
MRRTLELSAVIAAAILIAMAFHAWLASHDEQLRMQATISAQKQLLDAADARERARATALDQTLAQIQKLKHDTQAPEDILKQLPQYLNLPQPITLNSPPGGEPQPVPASAVQQGKKEKGTGLHRFGWRWFARKTPAAGEEQTSPTAKNSLASGVANSDVDSAPNDGADSSRSESQNQTATSHDTAHDAEVVLPDAANSNRSPSLSKRTAPGASQNESGGSAAQIPAADLKPLYDFVQDCRSCQAQLAAAQQNRADDAAKLAAITHERDAAVTAAKGGTLWRRFRRNLEWFAIGAAAGAAASIAASAATNSAATTTICHSGHCR